MIADRRHGWEPVNRHKIMPAKTKVTHSVTFRIKRSRRTKQFHCVVVAGNGEVILTGEPCKNRKDVRKMIEHFIQATDEANITIIDETVPVKKPRLDNVVLSKWP